MSADRDPVSSPTASAGRDTPELAADGWYRMPEMPAPYVALEGGETVALRPDRPWDGSRCVVLEIHQTAAIRVAVRPLQGAALGLLNVADAEGAGHHGGQEAALERVKAHAMSRKIAEDTQWFRLDPRTARDPERNPYYGSPAHIAWSQAASLRCGGLLAPTWLRDFDPFGGTLSQGVEILPGGAYPFELSKMAFAHRADWDLGRFFNAGPLYGLYDSSVRQPELGFYGLSRNSTVTPALDALYTLAGHPDWQVDYVRQSLRQVALPVVSAMLPEERGSSASASGSGGRSDLSNAFATPQTPTAPLPLEQGFGWPMPAPALERLIESQASPSTASLPPAPAPTLVPFSRSM